MRLIRRHLAVVVALTLIAAACSSSDDGAGTTTTNAQQQRGGTSTTTAPTMPTYDDDSDLLGVDNAIRIGVLDNGLTYYIRENDSPGGRAQLRLAVEAGSIQEVDDQRGVAHFLEHMAFNGTERFPANELVLVLQRFGAEFGPDINAYTSYEETVYELELPTDDGATVEAGFDVLFEWASGIALDPAEIDLERGVLVEEWRLRDQNFWGRYFEGVTEILLADSEYEDRGPLGSPDDVAGTTREGLLDFYETWYRPDSMAIVAVGDFDADVIERFISERFSALTNPPDAPEVPTPSTLPAESPAYFILADPEYPQAWAELNYPLPAPEEPATVGAIRQSMAFDITAPFFDPSFAANPLVRGQRSPGLATFTEPASLGEATEALLLEVRRATVHGFGETELNRALDEHRAAVELAYDERATTQDAEYADRYVEHFLGQGPIASADEWRDLQLRLLDEMTTDNVWQTFTAALAPTEPFVILVSPEADTDVIPNESDLREIVARTAEAEVEPWSDESETIESLMETPAATAVADRGRFSDTGLTEITLANGARVVFLPTTIRDDVVVLRAASPGGWSVVPAADAAEAQLVSQIVTTSGVGDLDQVDLERFLAGINASITPFIDETTEGFYGEAATTDLEPLLQLVNLYMTSPRFEQRAKDVVIAENLPFAADLALIPDLAAATELADIRFGGDARFRLLPPAEDLETFDLDAAAATYRDRFDDPGDFVFAFVGDFNEASLEDLARRYLGSIPGPGTADGFTDVRPQAPPAVVESTVAAGTGELGGVTMLFSSKIDLDAGTRIAIDLLELVLQQRLTERIREELSASYSPFAFASLIEDAEQSVELQIQISGDPTGLDEVIDATLAELTDLVTNGPTADELAIAQEQLRRDYELLSNEFLGEAVLFSALHPDELLSQVTERINQTGDATAAEIKELAERMIPIDRYIVVKLVPAG
jgi:zinc protease